MLNSWPFSSPINKKKKVHSLYFRLITATSRWISRWLRTSGKTHDLDIKKKKTGGGGRGEKGGWWRKIQLQLSVNFSQHRHKSNCPLLASLPQSMPHSVAVNFSSPKFLCRCIINSLSSCGKFKKKTPPYQVFTFLKKPQTFHSKNIPLAYFLLYRKKKKKKKSTYFSLWIHGSPFPIILLGRGDRCFYG